MDEFHWWREALKGNVGEIHEDQPQPGFYKMREGRDGPWLPVAIWLQGGELICRVAAEKRDAMDVWTWCAKNPVSKDNAKHAFAHGSWPGDVPLNSSTMTLQEEIADAAEQALVFLKSTKIDNKVAADKAANWRARLLDLSKKADKQRDAEKRPHMEAANAVQAAWKPSIDTATNAANTVRDALTQWMRAEDARLRAEADVSRRAMEEQQRKIREEQEAERSAAAANNLPPPPEPEPLLPIAEPEVKVQAGGQRGRKAALRTITRYVVTDYEAALHHCRHHPDVKAAVEKVASAQMRAGVPVPGVEAIQEQVAA